MKLREIKAYVHRNRVTEVKLEVICENESRTTEAISLIRENAKTGQPDVGWIYVSDIRSIFEI